MSCNSNSCNNNSCENSTKIMPSEDFPTFNEGQLPENAELIMLVNGADNECGGNMTRAYRLPLDRVMPGSSLQSNSYSVYTPNNSITIPSGTVVPAYTDVNVPNEVKKARADSNATLAKYIVVEEDPNAEDRLILQSSGFYTFSNIHQYTVGKQYYLSATDFGQVVTSAPVSPNTAQPLFYVVDNKTILINL